MTVDEGVELVALRKQVHDLKYKLTQALAENVKLERKLNGKFLYEHWRDADAPRVSYNDRGEPEFWHITLNEYQRANLLWLMCDLVGYCGPGVEPFTYANTGDWAGEIPNMLRSDHRDHSGLQPNSSVDYIADQVKDWRNKGK